MLCYRESRNVGSTKPSLFYSPRFWGHSFSGPVLRVGIPATCASTISQPCRIPQWNIYQTSSGLGIDALSSACRSIGLLSHWQMSWAQCSVLDYSVCIPFVANGACKYDLPSRSSPLPGPQPPDNCPKGKLGDLYQSCFSTKSAVVAVRSDGSVW